MTLKEAEVLARELGSVAALASAMGMTRQYVGRILKGERPVSDDFAREIGKLAASAPAGA